MIEILYFVLLLLLSGCLSSVETALFSLPPEEIILFKTGFFQKRLIARVMQFPEKLLTTILVANNFVNIMVVLLGASLIESLSSGFFQQINFLLPVIQFISLALIVFVFGEVLPKQFALKNSNRVAVTLIVPLYLIYILMSLTGIRYLISFLTSILLFVSRKILGKPEDSVDILSIQEGISLLQENGSISREEAILLYNIFEIQKVSIAEMMIHRSKMQVLSPLDKIDQIMPECLKFQNNQVPVYDYKKDQIVGIFNVRLALKKHQKGFVQNVMRPAQFLPMMLSFESIVELLRAGGDSIRILVNQFGEYEGVLTSKMIVSFLSKSFQAVKKGELKKMGEILDATTKLEVIEKLLNETLPKGEYHTIAGLILDQINRIPIVGECILIKGLKFFIEEVDDHRILKISINY